MNKKGVFGLAAVLAATLLSSGLAAAEKCAIAPAARSGPAANAWITQQNWLAPENLRYGLGAMPTFMPVVKVSSAAAARPLKPAEKPLDLEALTAPDPLDQQARSLAFLLNSRLYADGVLVIRHGDILFESYRHGLAAEQPRMLLSATRPVLAMLAASSTAQGKIRQEKAINRLLPELSSIAELRKISLHRLLNEPAAFHWDEAATQAWRQAGGWERENPQGNVRAWVKTAPWRLAAPELPGRAHGPEGQLVVWALEQAWKTTLPGIFCDRLFEPSRPEFPAYWATDGAGNALADGLALALRDFGRLGLAVLESRGNYRGVLPTWFAESIAAAGGDGGELPPALAGLERGSRVHFGFVNLAGRSHRAAVIGSHGNSLFIDFDRRLVVAIFASYPATETPVQRRTLLNVWSAIAAEARPVR